MQNQVIHAKNSLHIDHEFHHDLAASSHVLGNSPPGRTSNKGGPTSAVEATDYHEQDKTRFIYTLSKEFRAYAQMHHGADIIMIAPPRALALLRQSTGAEFKNRHKIEIDKDITKIKTDEFELIINKIISN